MSHQPPKDVIERLEAGPVAILGSGVSGRAVAALLDRLGQKGVFYDQNPASYPDVNNFGSQAARRHPLVVFSPGFPSDHAWLTAAREAGSLCVPELEFGGYYWRGRVVAITGTNGKTTLTEFLAHALNLAECPARVAGNIGTPLSRLAADDHADPSERSAAIAVCEVSSFQAETLGEFRCDALLWTNFAEDHLDRHGGMETYFAAKWRLVERTEPRHVFVGESVQQFAEQTGRWLLPVETTVVSEVKSTPFRVEGTIFDRPPQRANFLLAAAWWRREQKDLAVLETAARTFRPGRHRLECVGETAGVRWWNDSKATNFHAVEAALASFGKPVILIAGGRSKGGDLAGFVRRCAPGVNTLFLIGEVAGELATICARERLPHEICGTLDQAVARAAGRAHPGDEVLLSPGFASFDQFRDYQDRGQQFATLVNNLGVKPTFR